MCFAGLMEFKELFGSFTGHQVENRSTGMCYGSTGSARMKNGGLVFKKPSATGYSPSRTGPR
ncbi:hypothetical protein HanRHA438_Chr15g0727381 [Helianthus annuus]|nr:hypothetical protein HanRHA438_Chr15g0727381 [Helianthus annuus]